METKRCGGKYGCGKIKLVTEFHFANKKTGRLQVECKDCRNKARREQTRRKKEEYNRINGIVEGTDKCNDCGKVKLIIEFKKRMGGMGYERICKECANKRNKEYNYKDIEKTRERVRNSNRKRRMNEEIRKKENIYSRQFFKNNPNYRIEYEREKCKKDPIYRLIKRMRGRLKAILKNKQKIGSAIRDLGCSVEELKAHLESKFYPRAGTGEMMTWDNYGYRGWHLDHVLPLSSFDLTDREQLLKACNYTNLQPLWAEDNLQKSAKLDWNK